MNCLVIGPIEETSRVCAALRALPDCGARCTMVRLLGLASRHLLYSTPDVVFIMGTYSRTELEMLSTLVDQVGCDQIVLDALCKSYAVVRPAGRCPYALHRGEGSLLDAVLSEACKLHGRSGGEGAPERIRPRELAVAS